MHSPEQLRAACNEAEQDLQEISEALPSRFNKWLDEVRGRLPNLFEEWYPQVLSHTDLQEHNIHVSTSEGRMKGVVDWAGARVGPFGMSLYGLETLLGFLSPQDRWVRHARDDYPRQAFDEAFYKKAGWRGSLVRERLVDIRAARTLAIVKTFSPGKQQDAESRSASFVILEAYLKAKIL
jgi:aminoglycoside phosphotransferase (APT) family kinase protein